jgi:hypothetical protein
MEGSDFIPDSLEIIATGRIIRIAELEKENADLKKELSRKYGKLSHLYNKAMDSEIQNLKDKLANRDLNLADRDRRIESLEEDILLIAHLLQTVGIAAGKVTNQITSMEDIATKMADKESGWNR